MKSLARNQQTIYYATYNGKTAVTVDGQRTGEWQLSFSTPTELSISVSPSKGTADMQVFGTNLEYTKVLSTHNPSLNINEQTKIWYGYGRIAEYSVNGTYSVGDLCSHNGTLLKCKNAIGTPKDFDARDWSQLPHNYIVVQVAKSLNNVLYAIKEVDVSA